MYGQDIFCGISKATFEIPHKISYPYIERYDFYTTLKFKTFNLRAHICFWNTPQVTRPTVIKYQESAATKTTNYAGSPWLCL